jgi:hypothetical protein
MNVGNKVENNRDYNKIFEILKIIPGAKQI